MKNTKDFTKGQIVIVASNYDSKGTWSWQRARVVSCGTKQMTLETLDGEMMGRNFPPRFEVNYIIADQKPNINHTIVMADRSDEEAVTLISSWAAYTIEWETWRLNWCLKGNHGEAYDSSINRELSKLRTEARVITEAQARAETEERYQALLASRKA